MCFLFKLSMLCIICQASWCSIGVQRPESAHPGPPSTSSSPVRRAVLTIVEFNLSAKTSSSVLPFLHMLVCGLMPLVRILLLSSWFPCRIRQLFSPVFHCVVGVLLHCRPADRCRQQTSSCTTVNIRWTVTTARCQFLHFCTFYGTICISIVLQWMLICQSLHCIFLSRNILDGTGDIGHSHKIPIVVLQKSPTLPLSDTVLSLHRTKIWLLQ